jgi:hypothetical protein
MDPAAKNPTVKEIACLVVEKLTRGGSLTDLANANLLTIEEETIDQVDQVTRAAMNELLAKQSQQAEPPTACPRCGGDMAEKKCQGRSLQSRRGKVRFDTDVFHCEACRLDFFPSDENTSV